MTQTKAAPAVTEIRLTWGELDQLPVVVADMMHWRTIPELCYITIGSATLPMTDGPIEPGTELTIRPIVRIAVTPSVLKTWHGMLGNAVAEYEKNQPPAK